MNIFNRFKNIFKREEKASKTSPIIFSGMGTAEWTSVEDYTNFAKETYLKNVIAFRCIDLIAKNVASVPWNAFTESGNEDERTEINNSPINDLLHRANPEESFSFFLYEAMAYYLISGNVYLEKVATETGQNKGIPQELYALRPDRMSIEVDKSTGEITKYIYTVDGRKVEWDVDTLTHKSDILHIKMFHPTDDLYGASITLAAARQIDTYNEAAEYNKSLLENQAVPGLLYMYEQNLSDQQFKQLQKQLRDNYSGSKNAGKSMILEGIRDVKPYGYTPQELDFIKSNLELARSIAFAYGVPPQLVGIPDTSTYSNYKEARLAFWEDTIFWYLNLFREEINNWMFTPESRIFIDYNLDNVPAMEDKREVLWKRAEETSFLTVNEKREMVGLESIGDEGDTILTSATMIPLESVSTFESETEDGQDVIDEDDE